MRAQERRAERMATYGSGANTGSDAHNSVSALWVPPSVASPALLDTSLEREYALCRDAFEWSDDDLWSVARTSIDASFAPDEVKARLRDALARW